MKEKKLTNSFRPMSVFKVYYQIAYVHCTSQQNANVRLHEAESIYYLYLEVLNDLLIFSLPIEG